MNKLGEAIQIALLVLVMVPTCRSSSNQMIKSMAEMKKQEVSNIFIKKRTQIKVNKKSLKFKIWRNLALEFDPVYHFPDNTSINSSSDNTFKNY
jgi:hypothetical protein